MIRAGRGGVYASDWLEHGVIGIGWDFDGADIAAMNREQIRAAYGLSHPGDSKGKVAAGVGQVYRFAHDMTTDSTVVMYDPESRLYHLGVITGPCVAVCDMDGVTYTRDVTWGETAPRDVLSPSSKNSLGGIQTIFAVSDEVMADLTNAARDKSVVASNDPAIDDNDATNDEETLAATYDNGIELIKDRVNQLDWEDMERLVAGLLKAMGYCARVMPKVLMAVAMWWRLRMLSGWSRLALSLRSSIASAMGAPAVRAFIGGLRAGDRGLYVSTGGFTKEARYEADRANIPVRLLDLDAFVRHYVEIYDKTDDDTRSILPLTRIWWPA